MESVRGWVAVPGPPGKTLITVPRASNTQATLLPRERVQMCPSCAVAYRCGMLCCADATCISTVPFPWYNGRRSRKRRDERTLDRSRQALLCHVGALLPVVARDSQNMQPREM